MPKPTEVAPMIAPLITTAKQLRRTIPVKL